MGAKPIGERICLGCGALAVAGSMRCAPCRDEAERVRRANCRKRANARYKKIGNSTRKLTSTCPDCGTAIRSDSTRCLPCSLVFVGKRKAQREADKAAVRALKAEQVRAEREARVAAERAEAERIRAEKAAARKPDSPGPCQRVVFDREPVLPYAFRNIRPGSMSEALRIDQARG